MKLALAKGATSKIQRFAIVDFYKKLAENRKIAETDIAQASFDFLEFDRMSQQGTNDAASLRERARILGSFLGFDATST